MSSMVEQAVSPAVMLDKFPKCVLCIVVEIIDASGSEAAAAIQCAGLALADAAVEMYDIVTASSVVSVEGELARTESDHVVGDSVERVSRGSHLRRRKTKRSPSYVCLYANPW